MVNTKMFVFKHPKFYKILKDKKDQVISESTYDGESERAPDPGLKQQASGKLVNACIDQEEPQAPSNKRQASRSIRQQALKKI